MYYLPKQQNKKNKQHCNPVPHPVTSVLLSPGHVFRHDIGITAPHDSNREKEGCSAHVVICQYILIYVTICRYMSIYVAICRYMWLYVDICRYMSLYVAMCRYMSLYVVICRYMSLVRLFACSLGFHPHSRDHHSHSKRSGKQR